jgi:outer membrane protein OmpA-like peptidoglycan-associated protein
LSSSVSVDPVNDDVFFVEAKDPILSIYEPPPVMISSIIQVRDSLTGKAIENAIIEVYDYFEYINDINAKPVLQAQSNDKGRIKAAFEENQSLIILSEAPGYGIQEWIKSASEILRLNFFKPEEIKEDLNAIPTNIKTATISSGAVLSLDNIYYDYNKAEISPGSTEELEILAKIMKDYPVITIILTAHTDARGTEIYNQTLSENRAKAAKDYLLAKGIDGSRISTLGMGESRLRNECADGVECSEEEHQFNRRTEVRIVTAPADLEIRYQK